MGDDGCARLFDIRTMDECLEIYKTKKSLDKLAWNGDNLLAISGERDKSVSVIDLRKPGQ